MDARRKLFVFVTCPPSQGGFVCFAQSISVGRVQLTKDGIIYGTIRYVSSFLSSGRDFTGDVESVWFIPGKSFLSASSSLSLIAEKNAVFSEIMTMMTTVKIIISSLIIIMEYDIIGNCISFEI